MANQLITPAEAAADLKKHLDTLGPAMQRAYVYVLQTRLGGFQVDNREMEEILDAAAAELEKQQ